MLGQDTIDRLNLIRSYFVRGVNGNQINTHIGITLLNQAIETSCASLYVSFQDFFLYLYRFHADTVNRFNGETTKAPFNLASAPTHTNERKSNRAVRRGRKRNPVISRPWRKFHQISSIPKCFLCNWTSLPDSVMRHNYLKLPPIADPLGLRADKEVSIFPF